MNIRRQDYLILLLAAILLIVASVLVIFSLFAPATPSPKKELVVPTSSVPNNQNSPDSSATPTPTPITEIYDFNTSHPAYEIDKEAMLRMTDKFVHPIPLSASDAAAKEKILSPLAATEGSGILYHSESVIIDYTKGPNTFMVEILVTDIDKAKNEANTWFLVQGLSQDAICNLPVEFYWNTDTAREYKGKPVIFNPLGPGCK